MLSVEQVEDRLEVVTKNSHGRKRKKKVSIVEVENLDYQYLSERIELSRDVGILIKKKDEYLGLTFAKSIPLLVQQKRFPPCTLPLKLVLLHLVLFSKYYHPYLFDLG